MEDRLMPESMCSGELTPEVCWGPDGIDALLWADAKPYVYPPTEPSDAGDHDREGGLA